MIDLNPNDMSCVYSTLCFVSEQACKNSVEPVLTFDQPLWWKATLIIDAENADSSLKSVVLRLGAFHAQMSFLGSIGHIMAFSGLEGLLGTIYASNSATHIMSGKAVNRAMMAHCLVETALGFILLNDDFPELLKKLQDTNRCSSENTESADLETYNSEASTMAEISTPDYIENLIQKMDSLLAGDINPHEDMSFAVGKLKEVIDTKKQLLSNSRTATLWFQYLEMLQHLHQFIRAERTGDWKLHLSSLNEMLPYFAATGHNLYAKSAFFVPAEDGEIGG